VASFTVASYHDLPVQVPSTDGVTVTVHDLGGEGEPLVLAHATGFCGRVYEPLAALLSARHHVYALDFRGHGETETSSIEALDWRRITDDLDACVGAVAGGAPIPVFGHSMGGACALLLESRLPGTFRCAYVYEPIVLPPPRPPGPNALAEGAARRRASFPSRGDALLRYAERPPLSTWRADALLAYVQHGFRDEPDGSVTLRCAPAHEAAVFAGSGAVTLDDLAGVHIPVTVATGAVEAGFSPAQLGEAQVDALPSGRLERFEHLGHLGPMQDPPSVAAAILAFVA
jgi:pimeloyl-ACP methyl ester carboxylesterase